LFDLSELDCNKSIVLEMLRLLCPNAEVNWNKIDTNSHRLIPILFQPGTFIRILKQHDGHNYNVNGFALICSQQNHLRHRKMKTYLQALKPDGQVGNNLFLFNPYDPEFDLWPEEKAIAKFVEELPEFLSVQAIVAAIKLENENE
jgi:hypothetical protein